MSAIATPLSFSQHKAFSDQVVPPSLLAQLQVPLPLNDGIPVVFSHIRRLADELVPSLHLFSLCDVKTHLLPE